MATIEQALDILNNSDLNDVVRAISDDLACAETCEVASDVVANLREARKQAVILTRVLDDTLAAIKEAV